MAKKRWTDDWYVSTESEGYMERVCTQFIYNQNYLEIYYANEGDPDTMWTYKVKPEYASTYAAWFRTGKIVPAALHKVTMIDPINHKRGDSIIWVDCQVIPEREIYERETILQVLWKTDFLANG